MCQTVHIYFCFIYVLRTQRDVRYQDYTYVACLVISSRQRANTILWQSLYFGKSCDRYTEWPTYTFVWLQDAYEKFDYRMLKPCTFTSLTLVGISLERYDVYSHVSTWLALSMNVLSIRKPKFFSNPLPVWLFRLSWRWKWSSGVWRRLDWNISTMFQRSLLPPTSK